jgi:hypothetical protein
MEADPICTPSGISLPTGTNVFQISASGTYEFKIISYFDCSNGPANLRLQIYNDTAVAQIAQISKNFGSGEYQDLNLVAIAQVGGTSSIRVVTITSSSDFDFQSIYMTITRVA